MGWLFGEICMSVISLGVWWSLAYDLYGAMQVFSFRSHQVDQSMLRVGETLIKLKGIDVHSWGEHYVCGRNICLRYKQGKGLMQCQKNYCETVDESIEFFGVTAYKNNTLMVKMEWASFNLEWVLSGG
jgi:hypothetical protein